MGLKDYRVHRWWIHAMTTLKFRKYASSRFVPHQRRQCFLSIFSAVLIQEMEWSWPCAAGAEATLYSALLKSLLKAMWSVSVALRSSLLFHLQILTQHPNNWGTEPVTWSFPALGCFCLLQGEETCLNLTGCFQHYLFQKISKCEHQYLWDYHFFFSIWLILMTVSITACPTLQGLSRYNAQYLSRPSDHDSVSTATVLTSSYPMFLYSGRAYWESKQQQQQWSLNVSLAPVPLIQETAPQRFVSVSDIREAHHRQAEGWRVGSEDWPGNFSCGHKR